MSPHADLESDQALLGRASRDPEAFAELYRRHVGPVTRFLARRCATPEDVADAVSATFLSVLLSSSTYVADRGSPTAWLYSVAANAAKGQWRASARDQRLFDRVRASRHLSADDQERIAEMIDAERGSARVRRAVNDAPHGERELLAHMVARDVGAAEAARGLGITSVAARTRLARLRRRVGEQLDGPEPPRGAAPTEKTASDPAAPSCAGHDPALYSKEMR